MGVAAAGTDAAGAAGAGSSEALMLMGLSLVAQDAPLRPGDIVRG